MEKEVIKIAQFELYTDNAGEYRWRIRAEHEDIIADSYESYVNKPNCTHGIELVKQCVFYAEVEDQT